MTIFYEAAGACIGIILAVSLIYAYHWISRKP